MGAMGCVMRVAREGCIVRVTRDVPMRSDVPLGALVERSIISGGVV